MAKSKSRQFVSVVGYSFTLLVAFFHAPNVNAVEFSLFGDANFHHSDDPPSETTFRIGEIDLIANQEISPKSSVDVEMVFEQGENSGGYEIDVERFAISRQMTDATRIGMGRFHTPLGIWNANYHHGSLIQDTVTRPFFLEFEDAQDGILPVHLVGFELVTEFDPVNLQVMLGNNNGMNTRTDVERRLEVFNHSDPNSDKTYALRSGVNLLDGKLEFGASYMQTHVIETGVPDPIDPANPNAPNSNPLTAQGRVLFDQTITGLDFHWQSSKFYVLSEFYQIEITDSESLSRNGGNISNGSYNAVAAYTQFGYHYSKHLTMALRYETLDFDPGATYFQQLEIGEQTRNIAAISYLLEESNALRFEVSESKTEAGIRPSHTGYTLQWYFLLF